MKRSIIRISLIVVLVGIISISLLHLSSPAQSAESTVVKLYSGDTLVATWQNAKPGRIEGNTYVFTYGMSNREVRISGTYSVESAR